MITFNMVARNGNFYRGHEPCNVHGNCWGDEDSALVFTIDQARELIGGGIWGGLRIVVSVKSEPMSDWKFRKELFCAQGGNWHDYLEDD